jgi:hypothetical protein
MVLSNLNLDSRDVSSHYGLRTDWQRVRSRNRQGSCTDHRAVMGAAACYCPAALSEVTIVTELSNFMLIYNISKKQTHRNDVH